MKKFFIIALLLLPIMGYAKSNKEDKSNDDEQRTKVLTGFTGGLMIHGGYAFSSTPAEMFRNISIEGTDYFKSLPKDGVTLGFGGQLRLHFLDHIHVGGEGSVSIMPLAGQSSISSGWGGGFIDGYFSLGPVRPFLGLGIGGGKMKRLFVPSSFNDVLNIKDSVAINASYSSTPFFYLDPYIGLEILLRRSKSIFIKIDYQLPFSSDKVDIFDKEKQWDTFIKPSGPRLYFGLMFGNQ